MTPIKEAAAQFLTHQRVAVTGVSRDAGSHGSNVVYQRMRDRGYQVFPVNPNAETVAGYTAYPDLASIPGGVEAVVIATPPEPRFELARQALLADKHLMQEKPVAPAEAAPKPLEKSERPPAPGPLKHAFAQPVAEASAAQAAEAGPGERDSVPDGG